MPAPLQIALLSSVPESTRSRAEKLATHLAEVLAAQGHVTRHGLVTEAVAATATAFDLTASAAVIVCASELSAELRAQVEQLRQRIAGLPLLLASETSSPEDLRELLRVGIDDFVTPPFRAVDVLPRLWRLTATKAQGDTAETRLRARLGLRSLVGQSPAFTAVLDLIPRVAGCDATVLISGETGTGKEVVARAVHYLSPRQRQPFVPVNCGAIPLELVENELFGHERQAFTGASSAQPGLIREAEGGTLFLDEIDSLPLSAQIKLLRFLQDKEYRPLGSTTAVKADVRLIAASNADFEAAVSRGRLRQDLYYRLNVLRLKLPPLRERSEDLPLLAHHFLRRHADKLGRPAPVLSLAALRALFVHSWPGNVRELEHVLERAVILSDGRQVTAQEIQLDGSTVVQVESFKQAKAAVVTRFERAYLQQLLLAYRGNISQAADAAQKNRRAFFQLIRKYGIDVGQIRVQVSSAIA